MTTRSTDTTATGAGFGETVIVCEANAVAPSLSVTVRTAE